MKSGGKAGVELAKVLYDVSPKIAARKQLTINMPG